MLINERRSWTLAILTSRRDCSFCVVGTRAVTCHRRYRLTCSLSHTKLRVHRLLLGMAQDPCNKLDLAPGVPPVRAQPMAGEVSGSTSLTLNHPTRMTSGSLFEDRRPLFRGNQALVRKCDRTAVERQTVKPRAPLGEARLPVRPSTAALTPPQVLHSKLRRLAKSHLLASTTLTILLSLLRNNCRRPMARPTVVPIT